MNRFLLVVVLYEMSMSESPTVCSLLQQRASFRDRGIHVMVINNTPGEKASSLAIDNDIDFLSFGENRGLAAAYQVAFFKAKREEFRFLAFFDQDSEVTSAYISALDRIASEHEPSEGIWCPDVFSCGKRISPYSLNAFGWPSYRPATGSNPLYAINSFTVVSAECIGAIGGFNQFYWLDCLDFWLFETAQRSGWTVRRLGLAVKHNLSLVSGQISLTRMKNIAFYESCFVLEHGSMGRIAGTILRVVGRGLKRMKMIGGARNYGSYLLEILKGMRIGLRRRRNNAA